MSDISRKNIMRLLGAWQAAWRTRSCPPVEVLADEQGQDALEQHLELCPWCREAVRNDSFRAAASISQKLRSLSGMARVPRPSPGMIFFMNPELGAWVRGGRYIVPPAVLVISMPEKSHITVAQIAESRLFAGPGDIPLGNGLHGFAQSWNTYRVNPADFLMLSADTGDASAEAVIKAKIDQADEKGPEPGSMVWFYRQLEIETGQFVSKKSCYSTMLEHDPVYVAPDRLVGDLVSLGFHIPDDLAENSSPDQIILMAEPPETSLPLAAAGGGSGDGINTHALLFNINRGRVTAVEAFPVNLTFSEYAGGLYRVTGRLLPPVPDTVAQARLHWLLRIDTEAGRLQPVPGMSGSEGSMFWAAFNIPGADMIRPHDLVIRITVHSSTTED